MIEETTETGSKIKVFFTKLKHCFKMLGSNKYVFLNLDCKKQNKIEVRSIDMDNEQIKELFANFLLISFQEKYTKEKVDQLMSEINERN